MRRTPGRPGQWSLVSSEVHSVGFHFVTNDEGYSKGDVDELFAGTDQDPESISQDDLADALQSHLRRQTEIFIRAYPSLFRQYLV